MGLINQLTLIGAPGAPACRVELPSGGSASAWNSAQKGMAGWESNQWLLTCWMGQKQVATVVLLVV